MAQVISIFKFLKQYNELSNPVVTELENQKWQLDLADLPRIEEIKSVFTGGDAYNTEILKVIKPIIKPCPNPSEALLEWLEVDRRKLVVEKAKVKEILTREQTDSEGKTSYFEERFDNNIERLELFNEWQLQREQWREVELPRDKGLTL